MGILPCGERGPGNAPKPLQDTSQLTVDIQISSSIIFRPQRTGKVFVRPSVRQASTVSW